MRDLKLTKIRHRWTDNAIEDVGKSTRHALETLEGAIKNGSSIAVAVGSRGIDNLEVVVKEVVRFVRKQGGEPFIVPAMGSHGGATAEGQAEVLAGYWITEQSMGAPIRSSMEVIQLPGASLKNRIFMDKKAYESDGIILINKVKPHTDFHATYESGLVKMAVIGLGKESGAEAIHHYGVYGLKELIPDSAKAILATNKILGGVAMVENAYDKTMIIKAIKADKIMDEEPKLLEIARANRPRFPVDDIDVLIIDQMGKNISGVGIDTNIIGRLKIHGQPEPSSPAIRSIIVTDLTDESHGNATGVGLADIITAKLYDKIDYPTTLKNVATSSFLERGKIPLIAKNDEEAMHLALRNCGNADEGKERIIRIKDTLHLDELYVSDAILDDIKDNPQIEIAQAGVHLLNEYQRFPDF